MKGIKKIKDPCVYEAIESALLLHSDSDSDNLLKQSIMTLKSIKVFKANQPLL